MKTQIGIEYFGPKGGRMSFYITHTNPDWIGFRRWNIARVGLVGLYVRWGQLGHGWCRIL